MLKTAAFAGLLGSLVLLTACETGAPENDGSTPPPASTAAERKPRAGESTTPAATAPRAEPHQEVVLKVLPVGMPECDALMEKFKACLETKVNGTSLTSLQFSLEYRLRQWHEINNRSGGAAALLQECTKARAEMRAQLLPYGCEI